MLRRLVILFIVLLSAVTISTVAIGVADKVVPTCEDGHTWDLALVTEQATCTEEGKLTKTCKVCGETEEIVMDALGHDLVAVAGSAKEPSCEEDGYTGDKECLRSGCSYIEEGEVIPADGHDYDKVVTAPTCEEDGYTTYTCDCGKSYIADEVDALGHAYGEWTSNGDGTHKRVCANDTAHVESGNCAGGTATCQELAECSVCGGEYGELLAHTYNQEVATSEYLEYAANCQSPATYFKSCVCGAKGTETFTVGTPSGNHNYDREVVHEDYIASGATCTEPAKYFYTCVCGLKGTATFSNGEALGHTWEEVVLEGETNKATDATCVTKATYYKVCDCNTVSTNETFEYGDYADHDYSYEVAADEYIAIKGNCQTATTYFKSCVCGEASTTDTFVGDEVGDHDFSEDNECVCGLVKVTATVSIEDVATENGWVSNSQYPSFVVDSHIKVSSVGGQHTGKYNSNEHSYRIYATDTTPGSITISAEYIQNLVSIKFTTEEGEYAFLYLDGTTEDVCNKVVNVDGNSVTFNSVKNGENGKHVRITAIEVVYVYKPCTTHIAGETKGYDETQHWDICSQCGEKMTETVENHIYDGTPENTSAKQHTVSCDCGATTKEDHSYNATSGKCDCGAEKPSEGDEPAGPVTITTVIEDYATANHWADATMYDTVMMDDIITVTAAGSGDIAKYYLNGFEWRMYQAGNNEFTVVAVDGYEIISVKVTYRIKNSGVMTYNGANVATETLVEVNATSATFGVGNTGDKTNGQVKITAIEVIYKEAASSSEPTCEHTNTTIDQVNVVNATCTEDGSYEEVVTCDACGEELSRTHKTTSKTAHTPAEAVQEDVVPATCYAEGSYNSVVYCSVEECKAKISSTPATIEKIAHTPAEAVQEDVVAATCYAEGSYNSVVYCSVEACKAKISSTPETIEKIAHTPAEAVQENVVNATCYAEGSYNSVVYCSVEACKEKISSTPATIEKIAHSPAEAVIENVVPSGCTTTGSYDTVVYCSVENCKAVISRVTTITDPAHIDEDNNNVCDREGCDAELCASHNADTWTKVDENTHKGTCTTCGNEVTKAHTYDAGVVTAPTCTTDGYTTYTCACEHSYKTDIVLAAHTPAEAVQENIVPATCYAEGSYNSVVYCSVETCKAKISSTPATIEKIAHTPAVAVVENDKPSTCTVAGSYDSVVYCSVEECKAQISRTTITKELADHDYTNGELTKVDGEKHTVKCVNCTNTKEEAHNIVDGECACGLSTKPVTVTTSIADYATTNSWVNSTQYTTVNMDKIITVTASDVGNTGKYYTNGNNWRMYQTDNATFTIAAVDGYVITSVKVTYTTDNSGVMTYNGAQITSGTLVEVNATSATFGVGNTGDKTNGQVKITAIEVTYKVKIKCATCTPDAEMKYDQTQHWQVCSNCGEQIADSVENHTTTTDTVNATCTATGSTTTYCDCGYSVTEEIPMADHNYVDGTCSACGAADPSAGGSGSTEPTPVATFDFGANGEATHDDGKTLSTYTDTVNNYKLTLTDLSKVYGSAYDATGKSALKLGSSGDVGSFSFTVANDVTKVVINVANYKAKSSSVEINGTSYTLTTSSNSGEYQAIEIDTTSTKTITFTSGKSGDKRCMIDSIVFYA